MSIKLLLQSSSNHPQECNEYQSEYGGKLIYFAKKDITVKVALLAEFMNEHKAVATIIVQPSPGMQ